MGAERLQRNLLNRGNIRVPRVIHHHVDAAETLDGPCDRGAGLLRIRHVERQGEQPVPVTAGEVIQRARPTRGRDDRTASGQGLLGHGSAQPP